MNLLNTHCRSALGYRLRVWLGSPSRTHRQRLTLLLVWTVSPSGPGEYPKFQLRWDLFIPGTESSGASHLIVELRMISTAEMPSYNRAYLHILLGHKMALHKILDLPIPHQRLRPKTPSIPRCPTAEYPSTNISPNGCIKVSVIHQSSQLNPTAFPKNHNIPYVDSGLYRQFHVIPSSTLCV